MRTAVKMIGALALLMATARGATAAVIYTNEAEFNAALASAGLSTGTESFEGAEVGAYDTLDFGAFQLQSLPLEHVFITDAANAVTDGTKAVEVRSPVPTFDFDGPIRAFSMDIVDPLDVAFGDIIFSVDNRPYVLFSGQFPSGHVQFIGILDLIVPFTGIRFLSSVNDDRFSIDRVRFEQDSATPVPEPASLTLLGLGLAATGARLRRQRRGDMTL